MAGKPQDAASLTFALNESTRLANTNLEALYAEHKLKTFIPDVIAQLQQQAIRTVIAEVLVQIAILSGASVVGGIAGNLVAGAVRGVMLADAATASTAMFAGAHVVGAAAGIATDATFNALVQAAVSGDDVGSSLVDNALTNVLTRLAVAPIQNVSAGLRVSEDALAHAGNWERVLARAQSAVSLSGELILGAAVANIVQRARHGEEPDENTSLQWALQGASMVVGAWVGHKLHGFEQRMTGAAERGAHLVRRSMQLRELAHRVEQTGDANAAMELLAQRHELLVAEKELLPTLKSQIAQTTFDALSAGNRSELEAVADRAMGMMPLRLAGLVADDSSAKTWLGTTEDIARALYLAHRTGLQVDVLSHSPTKREWHIAYNNEQLTLIEAPLAGRPRAAETNADRARAAEYAQAAEYLREKWAERTEADLDSRDVVQVDHLQVGDQIAGVINQATLPATGENLDAKLIVSAGHGAVDNRGAQELGQVPTAWDAPGLRGSEQAPAGSRWIRSEEHARSIAIGRLEIQTPVYRGTVTKVERRPEVLADDWKAKDRPFRATVSDLGGTERQFYCSRIDLATGLGPSDVRQLQGVVADVDRAAMLASGQLIHGNDPEYASKLRDGKIFVWGGTPIGAWAAETAKEHGQVTLVGDTRPPGTSWPELVEEFAEVSRQLADHATPELAQRRQVIEARLAAAHRGGQNERNRKPGAAYHGDSGVKIEYGTPANIKPLPDGRVMVTMGNGSTAQSGIFDQVVIAHGQDPSEPGGVASFLGPGAPRVRATRELGDIPAGTILLRPVYSPDGHDVLALESIDPPGIRLQGAVYASKTMLPWIEPSERTRFEQDIDAMAARDASTRDYQRIGGDSAGVQGGIEVQRDRIPRSNEVLAAKAYRLPGPEHTLELDPAHPQLWDQQVREFFTIELRANSEWVSVERLGGGKSGAIVYRVTVGGNEVGVFKLFERGGAANEQEMLRRLSDAKLTRMTAVKERGRVTVAGADKLDGALLMNMAHGTSVKDLIATLPTEPAQRSARFLEVQAAVKRVADGLAELHAKVGATGEMMTREAKLSDANYMLDKNFRNGRNVDTVKAGLGADFERVKDALENRALPALLDAQVPASAYLGDANAGNFIVDNYQPSQLRGRPGAFGALGLIDVASMKWSFDAAGHGTKSGAADVGRFLESLVTLAPGKLTDTDLTTLRREFMETYTTGLRDAGVHIDPSESRCRCQLVPPRARAVGARLETTSAKNWRIFKLRLNWRAPDE